MQKSNLSTGKRKELPDFMETPSEPLVTINISISLMGSLLLTSFWTSKFCGTWTQQLLWHTTTLLIGVSWPFNILKHQLASLKQTYIRYSLHYDRWTIEGRGYESAFHSFKKLFCGRTGQQNVCYGWRLEWFLEAGSSGRASSVCDHLFLYISVAVFLVVSFISFARAMFC